MILIPAIDLKGGRCVRLRQGRMDEETVFSNQPEAIAERWYGEGAERLHVVDLDGAVKGAPINGKVIRKIVEAVPIPVELGGGVRDMSVLKAYLDLGVAFVIIGTAAYKDPSFVERACSLFPGKIILGVDARGGKVSVEGWTEDVSVSPVELVGRFSGLPVAAVVYTDISRDGMRSGPNIESTAAFAEEVCLPVIASGGISNLKDVLALRAVSGSGIVGAITGRALYDGSLDFKSASEELRTREKEKPPSD